MTDILQVNDYLINTEDFIGKGGYGVVYGCESKSFQNIKLCAKIIQAKADDEYLQREIAILQKIKELNEKHLVKIYDVISQYNQTFVIMERCDVGDLKLLIDQQKKGSKQFSLQEIQDFLAQIISGYKVLYENKMIHRDLKPANILLSYDADNKLILKLTDFSLGKVLLDLQKKQFLTKAGTPGYVSPQIYIGGEFSSKCDVFSLGVILYQLVFLKLPFSSRSTQEMIERLKNLKKNKFQCPNFPQNQGAGCNELQKLINRMLAFEEDDRISWEELFKFNISNKIIDDQSNIGRKEIKQQSQNILQETIQIYQEYQGEMLYFQEQKFNDIVKLIPQNPKSDQEKIQFLIIHLLTQAQFVFALTQSLQDILQKYFPKFDVYHFELIQTTIIGYRSKLLTNAYGFCSNNYKIICEEFRQLFGKENLQKLFQLNQQNQQQQKELILFTEEFWNQTQEVFLVAENNIIQLMKTNKYPKDITNFTKLMSVFDNTEYKIYGKWFEFFWKRNLKPLLILDNTLNQKIEYLQLLVLIEKFLNLNVDFSFDKIFQSNPQSLILDKKITKQQLELMVKQRKNV